MKEHIIHPIPPFYDADSRILILGSFPSVKSREQMFFYGHPQNRFWKVIAGVFEDREPVTVPEKKVFLKTHHIALWDVIGACDITGSSDSSIGNVTANDLSVILEAADIAGIFVNGKTAERYYQKYIEPKTGRKAVCLPSTSPANAAWNMERLKDTWSREILSVYDPKVEALFAGWEETLIWSCLQKVMGKVYVTDSKDPKSALAYVGCFGFYAGEPDRELVLNKPEGFMIMVPQDEAWGRLIEECFPTAKKFTRYAIKKDTVFDRPKLKEAVKLLPSGYELKRIDAKLYDLCLEDPVTRDFVSSFESKEKYLQLGRGMVILKNGRIVSGASSYTRYRQGIEIEVDTVEEERRKHLAYIACAALILRCLEEGLYPSWDAHNQVSVHLAEKLGYEFSHEYTAYEVSSEHRTH